MNRTRGFGLGVVCAVLGVSCAPSGQAPESAPPVGQPATQPRAAAPAVAPTSPAAGLKIANRPTGNVETVTSTGFACEEFEDTFSADHIKNHLGYKGSGAGSLFPFRTYHTVEGTGGFGLARGGSRLSKYDPLSAQTLKSELSQHKPQAPTGQWRPGDFNGRYLLRAITEAGLQIIHYDSQLETYKIELDFCEVGRVSSANQVFGRYILSLNGTPFTRGLLAIHQQVRSQNAALIHNDVFQKVTFAPIFQGDGAVMGFEVKGRLTNGMPGSVYYYLTQTEGEGGANR